MPLDAAQAVLPQSPADLLWQLATLVLAVWGIPWLRSLSQSQRYQAALDQIDRAIAPAVEYSEQVVAGRMRAPTPRPGESSLTTEGAEQALATAVHAVRGHFGSRQLATLARSLGVDTRQGLDGVLRTRIEAQVYRARQARRSPPAPSSSVTTIRAIVEDADPAGDSHELL